MNMIFKNNSNFLNFSFQRSDIDLAKDWKKEHKLTEMISRPLVHIYQPILINEGNNINISETTNSRTFNSGSSEKNISKRDWEKIYISILFG